MIFFPDNIKEIQKDMEDKLETFYHYDLIKSSRCKSANR